MKRLKFAILTFAAFLMMGCSTTPTPDLGEAAPARLPALPEELAAPAEPLPPSTAQNASELILEGIEDDRRYNALKTRYNTLLSAYQCLGDALANRKADDELEDCLAAK